MKHGDIRIIKRFIFGTAELNGITRRWQWAYINEHKKFDKDMFKIPLNKATWWNYRWDKSQ